MASGEIIYYLEGISNWMDMFPLWKSVEESYRDTGLASNVA